MLQPELEVLVYVESLKMNHFFCISAEVVFPDYWVPQPTNPNTGREVAVHLVQLDPTTDAREYKKVSDQFCQSGIQRIIRIQRIQNPTLYKEYASKKQKMDEKKAPGSNEMCLFHGAKGSDCNDINRFGLFCHKESEYIRLIAAFCKYRYLFIYPVRCLHH